MPAIQDGERRLFTCDEFHRMAQAGLFEGERVELLRGVVRKMSPIEPGHASAGDRVIDCLRAVFGPGFLIREQKPLSLGKANEPEPDVAVVKGVRGDFDHEHPRTAVLVVEISDSSLKKDRQLKGPIYAEAGIPEYWLLNLTRRVLEVYRRPEKISDDFAYAETTLYREEDDVSPLSAPEAKIRVAELLPRP